MGGIILHNTQKTVIGRNHPAQSLVRLLPKRVRLDLMSEKDSNSLDILGIKPVGEAVNSVVKGTVDGAAAFLSRICLPAAEEFGLLLRDKVSHWRTANLIKISQKAEKKLKATPDSEERHAHPRLVHLTLENGSWADSNEFQEMWAGLLASSCTKDGRDESNLIFINLLSQLTSIQVRVLNYSCEKSEKSITIGGWLHTKELHIPLEELQTVTGIEDFHRLDRELDHLRSLELITSGFDPDSTIAEIAPTTLALHLYVRCQGSLQSPVDFFGLAASGNQNTAA